MEFFLGLPWILATIAMIAVTIVIMVKRYQEKQIEKRASFIIDWGTGTSVEESWVINWLAKQRNRRPNTIVKATPISPEEVRECIIEAIFYFRTNLLRDTSIKNIGQLVSMIKRQRWHESRNKESSNA